MRATTRTLGFIVVSFALTSATAPAQESRRPVLDPARLAADPTGRDATPAAVSSPAPSPAQRWRLGLADLLARYETDLAVLRERVAATRGPVRAQAERQLQARKLDFEIELIELQLAIAPTAPPVGAAAKDTGPAREEAVRSLRESATRLRELRDQIAAGGRAVLPSAREE